MSPVLLWLAGLAVAALVMFALWLVERARSNATAVDVGWAANLGLIAVLYAAAAPGWWPRRLAVGALVVLWSARLAWHLYTGRVASGREEDSRYRELRERWGERAHRKFFWFYQAQALTDALLSLPVLAACRNPTPAFHLIELAGFAVVLLAVAGEAVADRQLAAHRADPARRGRTCRSGLWRWSRHPNYFFEWLYWCGLALVALTGPAGWTGLLSPALMLYLILAVTGIPPTEAAALRSRGDDYRDYQRSTSAFFPWFPRDRAR